MSLLKETLDQMDQSEHKKRLIQAVTGAIETLEMRDDPALMKKVDRLVKEHLGGRIVKSLANDTSDLRALLNGLKGIK